MKTKKELNLDVLKKISISIAEIAVSFCNVLVTIVLLFGALSSIILLIKLFPTTAYPIIKAFQLLMTLAFKIIIYLISASVILFIFYILVKYCMSPYILKRKAIMAKKREEYRTELVNEIVSKLRRKR